MKALDLDSKEFKRVMCVVQDRSGSYANLVNENAPHCYVF